MHLANNLKISFMILVAFAAGCAGENKPSGSDISAALSEQLPGYLQVTRFDIEAMQNTGNDVEPNYIARFTASAKTQDTLYVTDGTDGKVVFLKKATEPGHAVDMFGKSSSVIYEGGWRHDLRIDGNPVSQLGRTFDSFAPRVAIVRGSAEETAHFAALEAANAEFNATIQTLPVHELIAEHYNTKGQFAGQFVIHEISASRTEKRTNDEFIAHAKYTYRRPSATEPAGEDWRTFTFRKVAGEWRIARMGPGRSARI